MNRAFFVVLQRSEHHFALVRPGCDAHELTVHTDSPLRKINAIPRQPNQFAFPQTCEEIHIVHQIERIILGDVQKAPQFHVGERVHLGFFQHGQFAIFGHVFAHHIQTLRFRQHPVNQSVDVANALGRQAVLLCFRIGALNVQRREVFQLDVTDVGDDVHTEIALIVVHCRMTNFSFLEGLEPFPAPFLQGQVGALNADALLNFRHAGG